MQQPGAASAQRQAALAALVADAEGEAEFEATHGDDGSSASSVTFDEHANDSDGNNVSAFQGATSSEVAAIAARFKAWAQRAASLREDQLLQRQADAFARGSLREAATPKSKTSAKKPSSARPARKPDAVPIEHASMVFLENDLQSKLTNLGIQELAGALAAASILNMGDVIGYTSGKQLREEIERSGEFKVPLHKCNALVNDNCG